MPTDRLFTGQRLDSTGLYYYGARYYDPSIGRFISPDTIVPDPSNPQTFNRYSYVFNNPLKYNDPSGNCPWCIVIGGYALWQWLAGATIFSAGVTWYYVSDDVADSLNIGRAYSKPDKAEESDREKKKQESDRRIRDRQDNPENWEPIEEPRSEPAKDPQYRPGTSNRQIEINTGTGDTLEHHWIEDQAGNTVHENWKIPDEYWPPPEAPQPVLPAPEIWEWWWFEFWMWPY